MMATWYRVTSWSEKLEPREVVRETAKMLVFSDGRKSMVETGWFHWFPTEAEALAAIAARKSADAKRDADKRIRSAAPDLLEALIMVRGFGCPVCSGDCGSANPPVTNCPMQVMSAAISRALPGGEGK